MQPRHYIVLLHSIAPCEVSLVLTEIVSCFNETLQKDPSVSEAIAAIQTLLEVIQRSNGEIRVVLIQYCQRSFLLCRPACNCIVLCF